MSFFEGASRAGQTFSSVARHDVTALAVFVFYAAAMLIEIALMVLSDHSGYAIIGTSIIGLLVHHYARKYGHPLVMILSAGTIVGVAAKLALMLVN